MFDPYFRWLDIPRQQHRRTFYQLLGIAPTEMDPDVIEKAALRQTARVRIYQRSRYALMCSRLLREIAQARTALLSPARRKVYDVALSLMGQRSERAVRGAAMENFCIQLVTSRLLSVRAIHSLRQRWQEETAFPATDLPPFIQWLLGHHEVTPYQVGRLLHGHADSLWLGPYKILDRVGKGTMTRVYKAQAANGGLVALKVLPPARGRVPRLLAHFEKAARAARRLKHANIVRTFQTAQSDGLHYLVLEYLEGESLAQLLQRRGRLPWPEAVQVIYQTLRGLQSLHEHGMVHGFLEPANLMLVPDPAAGHPATALRATVKILDMGMSRILFEEIAEASRPEHLCNGPGVLHDHLEELAPEQLCNPGSGDIRADLFSVGCVLYHCLTGQPAFPGRALLQQVIRHATEAPVPVTDFAPAVPERLQQILDTMLAKNRTDRYPTPGHAIRALRPLLSGKPEVRAPAAAEVPDQFDAIAPVLAAVEARLGLLVPPSPSPPAESPAAQLPRSSVRAPAARPLNPLKLFAAVVLGALPSVLFYLFWSGFLTGTGQPDRKGAVTPGPANTVKTAVERLRAPVKGHRGIAAATAAPGTSH